MGDIFGPEDPAVKDDVFEAIELAKRPTEDRSSVPGEDGRVEVALHGSVGRRGGECRLTALATALREQSGNRIEWLVGKVCALCLPPEEFELVVGVKVRRGWSARVSPHLLPESIHADLLREHETERAALVAAEQLCVDVVAYELLVTWKCEGPSWLPPDQRQMGQRVTIPVSWPASVLENRGQAAFRSRVRWLMSELVLARYGLDGYRESR